MRCLAGDLKSRAPLRRRYGTQPRQQAPEGEVGHLTGQRVAVGSWRQSERDADSKWVAVLPLLLLPAVALALAAASGCAAWSAVVSYRRHRSKHYEVWARGPGAGPGLFLVEVNHILT